MENFYILSLILEFLGEVMIAVSVVRVHTRFLKDHGKSRSVYNSIRKEKVFVTLGIVLMTIAFILQIYTR
jgi:uncharacterized membrane protein